jgi:hypothetical protein
MRDIGRDEQDGRQADRRAHALADKQLVTHWNLF